MTEETKKIEELKKEEVKKERLDDNAVYVGDKPIYLYCKAVNTILGKFPNCVIKTRGSFITKAVNIGEIAKREYNAKITGITTDSQKFTNKEGKEIVVSSIDITVAKK